MVDTSTIMRTVSKSKATISEHIKNVFEEGELESSATVRNFRTVQKEGNREVESDIKEIQESEAPILR